MAKAKKAAAKVGAARSTKTVAKKAAKAAPKKSAAQTKTVKPADIPVRTLRMELMHDDGNIEVRWSVPGVVTRGARPKQGEPGWAWEGYYVATAALDGPSAVIRKHLQELQGLDWNLSDLQAAAENYRPILARLVEAGQGLHAAILRGLDDESDRVADTFRKWFEKFVLAAPHYAWRIEVLHTSYEETIVPWALACVPMNRKEIAALDPREPGDYAGFWGARFKLSVRGIGVEETHDSVEINGADVGLACVMELDETAIAQIERWKESGGREEGTAQEIGDHFGWDMDGFNRLTMRQKSKDLFWYISLQHDGGAFKFGDQGRLRAADIKSIGKRRPVEDRVRVVLIVLDGDAIVRNDRGVAWLKEALQIGRSGLIAVEADIQNPQLRNFGWRLLELVLTSRLPLLDAMARARTALWPLGLLYGVYCNPVHTVVAPPPDESIRKVGNWLRQLTTTAEPSK